MMTVDNYRKLNPDCGYCEYSNRLIGICPATGKKKSKRQAMKCPCYSPKPWEVTKDGTK